MPSTTDVTQYFTAMLITLCGLGMASIFSPNVMAQSQPKPISITYTTDIPGALETNIEIASAAVNGLQQCDDISELAFNQVQQAIGNHIIQSAHSFGYFAAKVADLSLPDPSQCHQWQAELHLGESAQIASIELNIEGDLEASPVLMKLTNEFETSINTPFVQVNYQRFKDAFYSQAIAQGYFDIQFNQQQVTVLANNTQVNIHLDIHLGQRYQIRQFNIDQNVLSANVVQTISSINIGDPYSLNALNTLTKDLTQTGYFNAVQVRPDLKNRSEQQIDIDISGVEKAKHFVNFGVGVSSDEGPRLSIDWRRPRINQAGHSLRASLKASMIEQSLISSYKIPYGNPNTEYLALNAGLKHVDRNDSQSDTVSLAAQRFFDPNSHTSLELINEWQPSVFARFEYNAFVQGDADQVENQLIFVGASMTRLRTNHPLFPTNGDRQSITLETAQEALASDISLSRLMLDSAWLRPLGDWGWSLSKGQLHYLSTSDFALTPNTLRFYAGGDQSVRGFGYESISPLDMSGEDSGASSMVTLSQEFIYPINDSFRVAGFVDNAWLKSPTENIKAIGAGIGLHWQSPIGAVRVYLARGKQENDMTWRLHLVMGPLL